VTHVNLVEHFSAVAQKELPFSLYDHAHRYLNYCHTTDWPGLNAVNLKT